MSSLLKLIAASAPASNLLRPGVTVEIAFNAGYTTPAVDRIWTDVTSYVKLLDGIDITHGRQDERSQADANTCRLVLINSDGRFTPDLASSPYYPNVRIGRPLRVSVMTAAGYTSVRFVGYIDEWPLEWPAVVTTHATSAITATSRIARLGAAAPLGNHIYEEIKRDSPSIHYMLDNRTDTYGVGPLLAQAGTGTDVTFEANGPTDGIQAAQFAGGKYLLGGLVLTPESFSVAITTPSSIPSTTQTIFLLDGVADAVGLALIGTDGAGIGLTPGIVMLLNGGSSFVGTGPGASVCDGSVHHVAWRGVFGLYVDGSLYDTPAYSMTTPSNRLKLGRDTGGPFAGFVGAVAHLAFFASTLSAARVAAHADAALTGFAGETPPDRLARYAAWAGILAAEYSFSGDADTPMAHIDSTGQTPFALMQKVAETDGGVLHDSRDGILTYLARSARYDSTAAVTLDASSGQVNASYAPKLDRSSMVNEAVATVADGSDPQETVRAINQDSCDEYGPERQDIELATTDGDAAHAAAWWRVNTFGEPRARAPQLGVEIAHLSVAMQASILALNVSDRVAVSNLPAQSDAASKTFFVEGYSERIDPETHRFEFNVSPTAGFDVWTVEDPVYGAIDEYPIAY